MFSMCLAALSLGCCGPLWITNTIDDSHKEIMFQSAIRQTTAEPFLVDNLPNVVHSHPFRFFNSAFYCDSDIKPDQCKSFVWESHVRQQIFLVFEDVYR